MKNNEALITTIIFDMDGVLVDSEPINLEIISNIYKDIGADVPDEVHLSSLGVNSVEWWTFVLENYGKHLDYSPEELAQRERSTILAYMIDPNTDKRYFEGLVPVLEELKQKGYKTAVASASPYNIIDSIFESKNLGDYFDYIISSDDPKIKRGKPEPDIFLDAAYNLESQPEECLVIEDSERGLEAAKRANMKTAAFLSAPKPIDTKNADVTFNKYEDFFVKLSDLI